MPDENPRFTIPPAVRSAVHSHGLLALLSIALAAVLVYAGHERGVASHLSKQSMETVAQLEDTRAQVGALTAKLDSIGAEPPAALPSPAPAESYPAPARRRAAKIPKPDPRWKQMQTQLDAQSEAIESTRQEIASTRSDLEGSIAKTHAELVVLEKKGERNYFEFDLDKSKGFSRNGPVSVSLRKANTKHQYADLELLVDDRQLSKKHLNLYEPAIFYASEERQAVELVIIGISKNHIHGYISAPKYRPSELVAASPSSNENASNTPAKDQPRQILNH